MVYLACIHFCIPCCIPFNVYFWCVLVRTHDNEYTKTIRIPQSLCIHKSILSVRFKYTFPIRRLKYTISIQKYTFYRLHPPPVFYLFRIPLSPLTIQFLSFPSHCIHNSCILSAYTREYLTVRIYTAVAYYLHTHMYTQLCTYLNAAGFSPSAEHHNKGPK